MIPQDFLKAVTAERGVSDSEIEVLTHALNGEALAAIASNLGIRPEAVRKRLGEVYKKFKIGGAGPGKMAKLQQILVGEYQEYQSGMGSPHAGAVGDPGARSKEPWDWGEAPDVSIFYDRAEELATLEQWIVHQECRVVAVLGMAGIGKTSVSVKLAHQIKTHFNAVFWRSLRHAPPLKDFLDLLLKFLYHRPTTYATLSVNEKISRLIEYCRQHRCLLVFDSVEMILQGGELAGQYRPGYEGYGDFFKRLGEEPHQSCLVMTSLEKPKEVGLLEGKTLPVRSLQLADLATEEAKEIFKAKGLCEEHQWEKAISLYRGNPMALKIAATTIRELFDGNVSEFLKHGTLVFGEIDDLLGKQFARLSGLEKEIVYWLAIERQPVSLKRLRESMLLPVSLQELLEAVASLGRRSLLEKISEPEQAVFSLQPVVIEYVTKEFVTQICDELRDVFKTKNTDKFFLFRSHALMGSRHDGAIEMAKIDSVLTPISDRLRRSFRSDRRIGDYLTQIDTLLQGEPLLEVGYASENVKNLLGNLQTTSG